MTLTYGMLSLEDLADEVRQGAIDTVVVAFTDPYGRLMGKRFDAELLPRRTVADDGTHACDYLLTVDMEMEPVPGYAFANWERGYGDVHLRARPRHAAARRAGSTAPPWCCATSPRPTARTPGRRWRPRTILRRQVERAAALGFHGRGGLGARVLPLRGQLPRRRRARLPRPRRRRLVPGGLPPAAGRRARSASRRRRAATCNGSGVPVENSKGEWGRRPARAERALRRRARHGRPPRRVQAVPEGGGRAAGRQRDVHGQARRRPGRARAATSISACGRTARTPSPATSRSARCRGSAVFRWFLAGWMRARRTS